MAKDVKNAFLDEMVLRYGALKKLNGSQSLFEIGRGAARVYMRYSKLHPGPKASYGLREIDLRSLEGHPSIHPLLFIGGPAFPSFGPIFRLRARFSNAGAGD